MARKSSGPVARGVIDLKNLEHQSSSSERYKKDQERQASFMKVKRELAARELKGISRKDITRIEEDTGRDEGCEKLGFDADRDGRQVDMQVWLDWLRSENERRLYYKSGNQRRRRRMKDENGKLVVMPSALEHISLNLPPDVSYGLILHMQRNGAAGLGECREFISRWMKVFALEVEKRIGCEVLGCSYHPKLYSGHLQYVYARVNGAGELIEPKPDDSPEFLDVKKRGLAPEVKFERGQRMRGGTHNLGPALLALWNLQRLNVSPDLLKVRIGLNVFETVEQAFIRRFSFGCFPLDALVCGRVVADLEKNGSESLRKCVAEAGDWLRKREALKVGRLKSNMDEIARLGLLFDEDSAEEIVERKSGKADKESLRLQREAMQRLMVDLARFFKGAPFPAELADKVTRTEKGYEIDMDWMRAQMVGMPPEITEPLEVYMMQLRVATELRLKMVQAAVARDPGKDLRAVLKN